MLTQNKRQEYKRFLKEKKAEHKNQIIKILEDSGKDPRKFWSTIKVQCLARLLRMNGFVTFTKFLIWTILV